MHTLTALILENLPAPSVLGLGALTLLGMGWGPLKDAWKMCAPDAQSQDEE